MPKSKKGRNLREFEALAKDHAALKRRVDSLSRKVALGYWGGFIATVTIAGTFLTEFADAIDALTRLIDALARLFFGAG